MESILSNTGLLELMLVVLSASFLQTLLGFGFGMLSIPLFLLIGLSLPESILIVVSCSLVQTSNAAFHFKKDLNLQLSLKAALTRIFFMPIGVLYLYFMDGFDPSLSRRWAGIAIFSMLLLGFLPFFKISFLKTKSFAYTCWALSGFMATSIGVGGPPLVSWAALQKWAPEKTRSFTLSVFLMTMLPGFVFILWKFPHLLGVTTERLLMCLPALFIGLKLGKTLSTKLPSLWLKRFILLLLAFSSLKLIINP